MKTPPWKTTPLEGRGRHVEDPVGGEPGDDVVVTMGIDGVPMNTALIDHGQVLKSSGNSYFCMLCWEGHYWRCSSVVYGLHPSVAGKIHKMKCLMPSGLHVSRVDVMGEVYHFDADWEKEVRKIDEMPQRHWEMSERVPVPVFGERLAVGPKWGREETYISERLRQWIAGGKGSLKTPFSMDRYNRDRQKWVRNLKYKGHTFEDLQRFVDEAKPLARPVLRHDEAE